MVLRHGGDLNAAFRKFGIPVDDWLDLSTGISPWVWPVPTIPESIWQRLPSDSSGLELAAALTYGCTPESVLAVPGSQWAIEYLPYLATTKSGSYVAMPIAGYREHTLAWERAGHTVCYYENETGLMELLERPEFHFAVIINPNNPTAESSDPEFILSVADRLFQRGGFVVVDEAFIDVSPGLSVSRFCPRPGLVVLRSIGKFFGLAGLRLGFVLAEAEMISRLAQRLPVWPVSTVSRWLGEQALSDVQWQRLQRRRISEFSRMWQDKLASLFPQLTFALGPLFVTGVGCRAACGGIYSSLAEVGILVRLFEMDEGINAIRLGFLNNRALKEFDRRLAESLCELK